MLKSNTIISSKQAIERFQHETDESYYEAALLS